MSFTFSRALVVACSQDISSDGDASAPSNSTPTPDQSWWPDKTTEHSRLSRFGTTCGPLTGVRGEELLTWWLEASRARTCQSEERATASTESAPAYGVSSGGSFAKYDPAALKWRTHQCSLLEDSGESLGTWPSWGFMRDGECWELPEWVPPMNGTASGSVPTPVACMSKGSSKASLTRKSGRSRVRDRLDHYVMALDGGPLNPEYAEWLMNWPLGWTSLEPLAKEIFDDWRRKTQRAQTGASSHRAGSVRVMREASHGQASPRPQQTSGGDSFVPKLSPGGRCGTPSHRGSQGGREKVGESLKGGDVLLLWSDVHEGESASDNLLQVMREQTGMGASAWWGSEPDGVPRVSKGVAHRADRLKAIGNGQVSAVAATAWQILGGS